jgi:hypothetical protein
LDAVSRAGDHRPFNVKLVFKHVADGIEGGGVTTRDDQLRERRIGETSGTFSRRPVKRTVISRSRRPARTMCQQARPASLAYPRHLTLAQQKQITHHNLLQRKP